MTYEPPDPKRITPSVRVEVGRWVQIKRTKPPVNKELRDAEVVLLRAGDEIQTAKSPWGKTGKLEFTVQPGTYELSVQAKGYQPVHVPAFVVPRENVTVVSVVTDVLGAFALWQ